MATLIAKTWGAEGALTDLDVCMSAMLGSMLVIWAAAIGFSAKNISVWTVLINMLMSILVVYNAYGPNNSSRISPSGVSGLAVRSKILSMISLILSTGVTFFTWFWMVIERDANGKIKSRTLKVNSYMVWTSFITVIVSTFVTCLVALILRKNGKSVSGVSPDWSYGQAYGLAAASTLLVSLGLEYITNYTKWGEKGDADVVVDGEDDDDAKQKIVKNGDHEAVSQHETLPLTNYTPGSSQIDIQIQTLDYSPSGSLTRTPSTLSGYGGYGAGYGNAGMVSPQQISYASPYGDTGYPSRAPSYSGTLG